MNKNIAMCDRPQGQHLFLFYKVHFLCEITLEEAMAYFIQVNSIYNKYLMSVI